MTLKRVEIITGYHNLKETCQGCPDNFKSTAGDQLIYLTAVNYDEKGNKITPSYYCRLCAANFLEELGQETKRFLDTDYSKRYEEWKRLWKEIEFEKKIDSK